ncbi:MAG: hypothetical protein NXI23_03215 [Bacteroidetes bacterium]|jgi:hypothetical protein|nr:hypothetical protein [Bacteroidota bacterium]MDF1868197.1 hypothetical protein [Saprospiraceae bacterium]
MSPNSADVHIYLGLWYLKNNQKEQVWQYFEQGLEKGLGNEGLNLSDLQEDPSFEAMRKDPKWKELMQKYFPDENRIKKP